MQVTLKAARLIRGLTMREVADFLEVSVDTYRRIEKDPMKTTIATATKLSGFLDFGIEDIFFGDESSLTRQNQKTA